MEVSFIDQTKGYVMAPNIFVNAMYESYSWDSGFLNCFMLSSSRCDTEPMLCNKGLLNLMLRKRVNLNSRTNVYCIQKKKTCWPLGHDLSN